MTDKKKKRPDRKGKDLHYLTQKYWYNKNDSPRGDTIIENINIRKNDI
jgi:hypothetical protein